MSAHKQGACGIASSPILKERKSKLGMRVSPCRASVGNSQHFEYDLYELLGVERNASLLEIRRAYRWLQKKCHPDIAGLVGHDMSILLNQAYTTLCDPNERAVYDQSLSESSELWGYTGCPLYSKWFGPPDEKRAVFVDESCCVGCLKCALIAPNTFAIENRYGRARAVGQWADSQPVIVDAIKACPVDCITWVDRSQLAAFEFVMSKEPRVPIGVDAHSNGGVRSSDVFKGVERLLAKLRQKEKNKKSYATETPAQRKARLAAMEGVHARSGRWWYYFIGNPNVSDQTYPSASRDAHGALVPRSFFEGESNRQNSDSSGNQGGGGKEGFEFDGELHRLFEAAKKRRQGQGASPGGVGFDDEYWVPLSRTGGSVACSIENEPTVTKKGVKGKGSMNGFVLERKLSGWGHHLVSGGPVLTAALAAWFVGVTSVPGTALSSSDMGVGPVPVDWMESVEMQIISVSAIWYVIGAAVANVCVMVINLLERQSSDSSSQ
ncbi:hypothetical protein L7F22_010214 [Adiantum nelumboides]|nr:hypothetical protein [Adiantum nelumboides]